MGQTSSSTGECCFKTVGKDPAQNTPRVARDFTKQVSTQLFETNVAEHAFENINEELGLNFNKVLSNTAVASFSRGEFTMTLDLYDQCGRGKFNGHWKSPVRLKLNTVVSRLMKLAIARFSVDSDWGTGRVSMTGYTSYRIHISSSNNMILLHANKYLYGQPWYDWCMVQFDEDD